MTDTKMTREMQRQYNLYTADEIVGLEAKLRGARASSAVSAVFSALNRAARSRQASPAILAAYQRLTGANALG